MFLSDACSCDETEGRRGRAAGEWTPEFATYLCAGLLAVGLGVGFAYGTVALQWTLCVSAALGTAWFYGSGHYGAKPPGYAPGFVTGVGVVGAVAGALAGWRVDRGRMRASVIYEVAPEP